jgi:hypothetical protein
MKRSQRLPSQDGAVVPSPDLVLGRPGSMTAESCRHNVAASCRGCSCGQPPLSQGTGDLL